MGWDRGACWVGARHTEHPVGCRSAVGRRDCRSLRHVRVLCAGGLFYALGLTLMAYSTTPGMLDLGGGVFVGLGLAGCSFSVVLAAAQAARRAGARWPSRHRHGGGLVGPVLYSPLAVSLMDAFGWQTTLLIFGVGMLMVLPLSLAIATAPAEAGTVHGMASNRCGRPCRRRWVIAACCSSSATSPAASTRIHPRAACRPIWWTRVLSVEVGGWTIAVIGLFNIVGSLASGWLAISCPSAILLVHALRPRPCRACLHSVPVAICAGCHVWRRHGSALAVDDQLHQRDHRPDVRHALGYATLAGMAFFSHQVGGFLGVWQHPRAYRVL